MPVKKKLPRDDAPRWVVIVSVVTVAAGLLYFGRQAFMSHEADAGTPKKVYPGMYDIRAEAAKMRANQPATANANGAP